MYPALEPPEYPRHTIPYMDVFLFLPKLAENFTC